MDILPLAVSVPVTPRVAVAVPPTTSARLIIAVVPALVIMNPSFEVPVIVPVAVTIKGPARFITCMPLPAPVTAAVLTVRLEPVEAL